MLTFQFIPHDHDHVQKRLPHMYKINTCGVQKANTIAKYQQDQGKQGATLMRATLRNT